MEVGDVIERSNKDSAQVSTIIRQLCLAGIAIIWIFADKSQTIIIGKEFVRPMLLLITALCLDLLQYFVNAMLLKIVYHILVFRGKGDGDEFNYSFFLGLPSYIFLFAKFYFMAKAYLLIGSYLYTRLPQPAAPFWPFSS